MQGQRNSRKPGNCTPMRKKVTPTCVLSKIYNHNIFTPVLVLFVTNYSAAELPDRFTKQQIIAHKMIAFFIIYLQRKIKLEMPNALPYFFFL